MSKLWKALSSLLFSSWDDERQRERWMDLGSQMRKSKQNKVDIQKRQKTWHPLFKHPLPTKKTQVVEGEMEIGIISNEVKQFESEKYYLCL